MPCSICKKVGHNKRTHHKYVKAREIEETRDEETRNEEAKVTTEKVCLENECSICLEVIKTGTELKTPCNHTFHKECLTQNFNHSLNNDYDSLQMVNIF